MIGILGLLVAVGAVAWVVHPVLGGRTESPPGEGPAPPVGEGDPGGSRPGGAP